MRVEFKSEGKLRVSTNTSLSMSMSKILIASPSPSRSMSKILSPSLSPSMSMSKILSTSQVRVESRMSRVLFLLKVYESSPTHTQSLQVESYSYSHGLQ